MRIEKQVLDNITRCYATNALKIDGKLNLFFASEDPNSPCIRYFGEKFEKKEVVWNDRGGCMSILPINSNSNEVVAVNEFYLKVTPSAAKLIRGKYDGDWKFVDIYNHQYIHRFSIMEKNGINYITLATIAEEKENKEDWKTAGKIYGGILPKNFDEKIEMQVLVEGCFRNHGCYIREQETYYSSDQGVYKIMPPQNIDGKWCVEHILDGKISDLCMVDIDNDGKEEIMTIEPFHGNEIKIYKLKNGSYQEVYKYPNEIDFAHCLLGTTVCGKNTFIAGVRRKDAELFMVQYENGKFVETIIEKGVGPANIQIVHMEDCDMLLSANHSQNEAAIYRIYKD